MQSPKWKEVHLVLSISSSSTQLRDFHYVFTYHWHQYQHQHHYHYHHLSSNLYEAHKPVAIGSPGLGDDHSDRVLCLGGRLGCCSSCLRMVQFLARDEYESGQVRIQALISRTEEVQSSL